VRHVLCVLYHIRIAHMYRISQSLYRQHIDKGSHGQTPIWWSAVPSTNHYYSHTSQNIVDEKAVSYGQTQAEPAPPTPKMCYICIGQLKFRRNIR